MNKGFEGELLVNTSKFINNFAKTYYTIEETISFPFMLIVIL